MTAAAVQFKSFARADSENVMSRSPETSHVIGAGIGGLATAVALQQANLPVVVYDRAATLEPLGAGLSLWPNAVLALASLGVDGIVGGAIPRGGGGIHRWDDTPLAISDAEAIERRYAAPLVLVRRSSRSHRTRSTCRCGSPTAAPTPVACSWVSTGCGRRSARDRWAMRPRARAA